MSCQQVPRVTEDPYLFTETVPTTPTLFNPQIHKLTSFISNPIAVLETKNTLKKEKCQQTRLIHQQPKQKEQQPLPNLQWPKNNHNVTFSKNSQVINCNKINGITTAIPKPTPNQIGAVNQKKLVEIISSNTHNVNNSHNNSNSSIEIESQIVSNQVTRKILTSQQQSPQIISWNQTSSQITPPLYTLSKVSAPPIPNSITITSSPLLPPSNFHKNTLGQHMQSFTCVTTQPATGPIPAYVIHQQSKPKPKAKPKLKEQKNNKIPKTKQRSSDTQIEKPQRKFQIKQSITEHNQKENSPLDNHSSDSNGIPINFIFRNSQLSSSVSQVDCQNVEVSVHSPLAEPQSNHQINEKDRIEKLKNEIVEITSDRPKLANMKNLPVTDDIKLKSVITTDKNEPHISMSSIKKTLKVQSGVKTKQSYKESSHHEALQRITNAVKLITSPNTSSSLVSSVDRYWHAPDTFQFDLNSPFSVIGTSSNHQLCDNFNSSCLQSHWSTNNDFLKLIPISKSFNRDQRIDLHKIYLRRQAMRLQAAQQFNSPLKSRKRIILISKVLRNLDLLDKESDETVIQCIAKSCTNPAISLTSHCYVHITQNSEQYLFHPCTAKFSDNTQCQIPVFDVTHKASLCQEHAWKCDNYDRMAHEQKPKNLNRKRTRTISGNSPHKRIKKKRKLATETKLSSTTADSNSSMCSNNEKTQEPVVLSENTVSSVLQFDAGSDCNSNGNISFGIDGNDSLGYDTKSSDINHHSFSQFATMSPMVNSTAISSSPIKPFTNEMLSICENSYESSEDTGVGGLSETELIGGAHDVIEEIPLDHDFANVLSTIPVDALHELFNAVQQEEQEEVERALALADKQVKSLQQMQFLGDFLNVDDHILDETDICSDGLLNSPETSGIDANTLFVDGGSNSIESCTTTTTTPTPSDLRGLVQT